jgi:hypothetical protein
MRKRTPQTVEQRNATGMLLAIAHHRKHLYEGTVDRVTVAKRRARNKAARRARRNHRA